MGQSNVATFSTGAGFRNHPQNHGRTGGLPADLVRFAGDSCGVYVTREKGVVCWAGEPSCPADGKAPKDCSLWKPFFDDRWEKEGTTDDFG